MTMNISLVAALALNRAIGHENRLLYHLPDDMKRFKALTTGHTVVMGRKTFESLPKGALPNRRNIVLTRQDMRFEGAETCHSLEEALSRCGAEEEVFVIGGAELYRQSIGRANRMYLTLVHDHPEKADAFFPAIDPEQWTEESKECHPADEKHRYPYDFIGLARKEKQKDISRAACPRRPEKGTQEERENEEKLLKEG